MADTLNKSAIPTAKNSWQEQTPYFDTKYAHRKLTSRINSLRRVPLDEYENMDDTRKKAVLKNVRSIKGEIKKYYSTFTLSNGAFINGIIFISCASSYSLFETFF